MSKAKEEAEAIYNKHYCSILEYGEELSQEIVISLLAKKSALIHVEDIIDEYEYNICECGYDYDFEMWRDKQAHWQEVKQELKKML